MSPVLRVTLKLKSKYQIPILVTCGLVYLAVLCILNLQILGLTRPLDTHIASCNGCTRPNFTTLVTADHICHTDRTSTHIKLLILIFSKASNFTARHVVRKTWGSRCVDPASGIRCVFLLGKSDPETNKLVTEESVSRGDVLQFDFMDSYRNLTYKTIMGLQWVTRHCMNARHVLKTDDDMYVNTLRMPTELDRQPHQRFYGGYCWPKGEPIRDVSKWSVSRVEYAADIYPPVCSGVAYVFSNDVAILAYNQSQHVPFLYLEDVFFGISVYFSNITATPLEGYNVPKRRFGGCTYKLLVMAAHRLTRDELERTWEKIETCTSDYVSGWVKAWYWYELNRGVRNYGSLHH